MVTKNTKAKAETKPENEQNSVQQAPLPSPADDTGNKPSGVPAPTQEPVKLVVISARGLALRQEPSKQSVMLSVLPNGTVLTDRVAEVTAEGWIPVTTRDGKNGWVDCRFVSVVD